MWKEWKQYPDHEREPGHIRAMLTEQQIEADGNLAKFVTVKAYERAGGAVTRDLFDEDSGGWIVDADLLQRLAMEKLVKAQSELLADGWKWIEIMTEIEYSALHKFERLRPAREPDDEKGDRFTAAQKAKSGCILAVGHGGKLDIRGGLLRPEDAKAERKAAAKKKEKSATGGEPTASGISAKLAESLTAHRTAALAPLLSEKPRVALAAVVHALALDTLYDFPATECCLGIKGTMTYYGGAEGIEEGPAETMRAEATKAATKGMPKNPDKLWDWLAGKTDKELLAILAVCAACTVDAIAKRGAGIDGTHPAQLAEALKLDMAAFWQPTAASYFDHVSKDQALAAIEEKFGSGGKQPFAGLKKTELAKAAEKKLHGTRWLPAMLRAA